MSRVLFVRVAFCSVFYAVLLFFFSFFFPLGLTSQVLELLGDVQEGTLSLGFWKYTKGNSVVMASGTGSLP